MTCPDCDGTRAVPDDLSGGYAPCPSCVIDATTTFVVFEDLPDDEESHTRTEPKPDPALGSGFVMSEGEPCPERA